MAKTHGQRLKILYILDFLKRESDEEHPVTAKDICEFLDSQGISAERKSVYADISALIDYGADIVRSASPRGWFLASREFEEPEDLSACGRGAYRRLYKCGENAGACKKA